MNIIVTVPKPRDRQLTEVSTYTYTFQLSNSLYIWMNWMNCDIAMMQIKIVKIIALNCSLLTEDQERQIIKTTVHALLNCNNNNAN